MRILKSLLATVVILWGVMALLVRSATPFIADYRDELAALLADRLGAPVEIGGLQARWYGLRPLVELHDIRVGEQPESIEVRRAALDIALGDLISDTPLDALRMTVDGLQLTVVREPNGQVHLEGLGAIGMQGRASDTPPLPGNLRLIDTGVTWIDRRAGKAPVTIERIAILLDRDGSALKLRAHLDTDSGSADLAARLDGFLSTTEWHGSTYLRLDNLDVAALFAPYLPAQYGLRGMHLDLESWGQWRDALPVHSQGRFALDRLRLHPLAEDSRPLDLEHASARFSVSREGDALRVGVEDLELQLDRERWPRGRLAFSLDTDTDATRRLAAAADYLRIEDVIRILQVRLPLDALQEPFETLAPGGEIRDLRLQARIGHDHFDWQGKARFSDLRISASGPAPGVTGVSGELLGRQDHVVLSLDSRDVTLDYPALFRETLQLQRLHGRLDLEELDGNGWRLQTRRLAADAPHLQTATRLRLDHRPDQPLFVDLQTDFRDGDAANARRYYPAGIMGKNLVAWLDRSIRGGRVIGGSALFHGPADDFAFEETRSGSFQVLFDVADLTLDYKPGWPPLTQLAATVKFHGNQVDIGASEGRVYDSRIDRVSAHIGALEPLAPLEVRGRLVGPLRNNLRVLQEDALRDRFGAFAEGLAGEGDTVLDLDFRIPLGSRGSYALDGRLAFAGNTLALPAWEFGLSDVAGQLAFDLDGLSARAIEARALGAPVKVDVLPLADGATRVRAAGRLGMDTLRRQLPQVPLEFASGSADFVIDVDIPPGSAPADSPTMMSVASDLQGIAVDLPAPLGKAPTVQRRLDVRLPLSGRPTPGGLDYGNVLAARFSGDGSRVDVQIGGPDTEPAARLGTDPGIRISGRLAELDAVAWQQALARLPLDPAGDQRTQVTLNLAIQRLVADAIRLDDVAFNATRENGAWRGIVSAPNLGGRFTIPLDHAQVPVRVELDRLRLRLPLGDVGAENPPVPDPASGPDPRALPGLLLSVADLRVNDAKLGQLLLEARRGGDGLQVTRLNLRHGALLLDSAGHWSHQDGRKLTQVGGSLETDNLGDLLVALGYSRQLEKAGGKVAFLLRWPGDPAQFHRATVAGTVTLDIGSGRVLELDPGVTRVVGLLNLNALTRRLRLDFSDIYKKGYSFDSIRGDFSFDDGVARTDNLAVVGPSGRIDLDGSADLLARSLDQHVTVTPNLDATLPIAGTLAGGPVAGLAVLVAQKVMSREVDKINRFEYSLQGAWAEPTITQLDSGGTLSKILGPLRGNGATPGLGDDPGGGIPDGPAAATGAPGVTEPPAAPAPVDSAPPAPPATAASPPTEETGQEAADEKKSGIGNPLRGLLDVLRKGESHGADLPGVD